MRPEIVRAGPPACSASGWTTTSTLRGKRDESCMFRRAGSPQGYQPQTGDCPDGRQARDSTPALVVRPTRSRTTFGPDRRPASAGAGQDRHRVRRGVDEERARRHRHSLHQDDRHQGGDKSASSALAKAIERGVLVDVFASADLDWMDYLDKKKLLKDDSRSNATSSLVYMKASARERVGGFEMNGLFTRVESVSSQSRRQSITSRPAV
jgi:hypothetical protein